MRKQIILLTPSCRLILVLLFSCFAAVQAHSQQAVSPATTTASLDILYSLIYCPAPCAIATNPTGFRKNFTGFLFVPNSGASDTLQAGIDENNEDISGVVINRSDSGMAALLITDGSDARPANSLKSELFEMPSALYNEETGLLMTKYSLMISVEPNELENFDLYKFLDQWYGVKYKYGGTDNKGIDCSAFSQKLYGAIYSVNILRTARQQHKNCEIVKKYEEASEGDLVFFRIHHLRVSHVGVYLANGYFVHASRSQGVMISSLNDKYWHRRYAGCGHVERTVNEAAESDLLQ